MLASLSRSRVQSQEVCVRTNLCAQSGHAHALNVPNSPDWSACAHSDHTLAISDTRDGVSKIEPKNNSKAPKQIYSEVSIQLRQKTVACSKMIIFCYTLLAPSNPGNPCNMRCPLAPLDGDQCRNVGRGMVGLPGMRHFQCKKRGWRP